MHLEGFTPYADTLIEHVSKNAFVVKNPAQVLTFVIGGRDVHQKRIRRTVTTTLTSAWVEYQSKWMLTHLWVVTGGRRRLVHRKG